MYNPQLDTFIHVADAGSFNRAAEESYITPTAVIKQINLLEALARHCTGVTEHTLGNVCNQVAHWPHRKVKEAMQNLYAFTSDYPGIRHSGTPSNARRTINMRDMIAVSILLVGFTPYLVEGFDAKRVWRG